MMVEKGEVDVVAGLDGQQLKDLEGQSGFNIMQGPIAGFRQVRMMILPEFRGEPNPVADNMVREAIRWSIDYDGMIEAVWFGYATKLHTIVPHTQQGHLPLTPFTKDTTKAKDLLEKAGYADGLDLELVFRDRGDYRTFAEKLQSDLAESGINVELVVKGSAEYRAQYRERDWQLTIGGFGCDYEDPDAAITAFGPVNSVGPEEEVQLMGYYCGWVNSTIRSWIDEARTTVEWDDRAPLYEKIQSEILHNSPYAMIAEKPFRIYVVRTWIEGLIPHHKWHFRVEDIVKEGQ
jgi:peptide/nickel transport system substrate-binding protein